MNSSRISELLAPFLAAPQPSGDPGEAGAAAARSAGLSAHQLHQISTYIDLLLRWNARINLTSVRDPEQIVTRHFGESFFLARHLFPAASHVVPKVPSGSAVRHPAVTLIDVGSGAGFPGLPIKLWAPHIHLALIESNQKKSTFLREVVRAITLTNVDVFAGRAADLPGRADIVTLRAVERFEAILPATLDLLAPGGRLALLVGSQQAGRVRTLAPQLSWSDPLLLPLSAKRVLVLGSKESHE